MQNLGGTLTLNELKTKAASELQEMTKGDWLYIGHVYNCESPNKKPYFLFKFKNVDNGLTGYIWIGVADQSGPGTETRFGLVGNSVIRITNDPALMGQMDNI